jgi:hypothetical protein
MGFLDIYDTVDSRSVAAALTLGQKRKTKAMSVPLKVFF